MSRPARAAWYKCQTSVFSFSDSSVNPSAYTCTTAASSTRSRRYFRSAGVELAAGFRAFAGPPPHATLPRIDMITSALNTFGRPCASVLLLLLLLLSACLPDLIPLLHFVRRNFPFSHGYSRGSSTC